MHYTVTKNMKFEKLLFKIYFVFVYPTGESHPSFKQQGE